MFRTQTVVLDANRIASAQSWRSLRLTCHGNTLASVAIMAHPIPRARYRPQWLLSPSPEIPLLHLKLAHAGRLHAGHHLRRAYAYTKNTQHPNLSTTCDVRSTLQTKTKAASESTAQILDAPNTKLHNTTVTVRTLDTSVHQDINTGKEARAAVKEAVEAGKANLKQGRSKS
jgi:hypothetical protein